MVERCDARERDQGGQLRHSDIRMTISNDEKGAPAAFDEQSMTAHEACETGVYHLAGGYVVTEC